MKRQIWKTAIMMGVAVCLLTACYGNQANSSATSNSNTLTFLSNFPTDTLDPQLNYTPLRAGVVETLVKTTEDSHIEPWLAESWKALDNGTTWEFIIRDGVTFQNGKALDAKAVKASLERTMKVSEAMKASLKIKEMKADGQKLMILTQEPVVSLPSELVHPNAAIIDVTEKNIEVHPVGTGPFEAVSSQPNSKLELKKYDQYWDGAPKLDRVTMLYNEDANARTAALQSGEADIVYRPEIESLELLKKDPSLVVDVVPSLRTQMLLYNTNIEAFKDVNVRKAFDVLLNRQDVVDYTLAGQGVAANGPFLKEFSFAYDAPKKESGPDSAKEYLKKAGYKVENNRAVKEGKQLSFTILTYPYRPELPLMAQLIQSEAKKIGVKVDIQQVENMDEYMTTNSDWGIATYSLITAPRGDSSYYLNSVYGKDGFYNVGHYDNQALSRLIKQLNETVDEQKRVELTRQAGKIINDEALHSAIVHPNNFVAYKENVKGWQMTKSEYYVITKNLALQE